MALTTEPSNLADHPKPVKDGRDKTTQHTDIGTVQEGEEENQGDGRDNVQIALPDQLLLSDGIEGTWLILSIRSVRGTDAAVFNP